MTDNDMKMIIRMGESVYSKYTDNQIAEFKSFCDNHKIRFNNMAEYRSALSQYYL
jgi:hypothetical protein